ncbi:MAG: hypothetical protein ACN6OP_02445 [Pseudomonadales bacterium]
MQTKLNAADAAYLQQAGGVVGGGGARAIRVPEHVGIAAPVGAGSVRWSTGKRGGPGDHESTWLDESARQAPLAQNVKDNYGKSAEYAVVDV